MYSRNLCGRARSAAVAGIESKFTMNRTGQTKATPRRNDQIAVRTDILRNGMKGAGGGTFAAGGWSPASIAGRVWELFIPD